METAMDGAATFLRRGIGRCAFLSMFLLLLSVNQLPVAAAEPQVLEKSLLVLESGDRKFRFEVELASELRSGGLG
ncbi:MAG: hypothetical protein HC871_10605 [Rhizobiales bacterium]|nr:hypothetical protein [Hyphomicrobiales bacterium]